jgi:hypothetical protein
MIATILLVGGIIAALTRQIAWFAVVVATPLHYALDLAGNAGWDRKEIVEMLRQHGGQE